MRTDRVQRRMRGRRELLRDGPASPRVDEALAVRRASGRARGTRPRHPRPRRAVVVERGRDPTSERRAGDHREPRPQSGPAVPTPRRHRRGHAHPRDERRLGHRGRELVAADVDRRPRRRRASRAAGTRARSPARASARSCRSSPRRPPHRRPPPGCAHAAGGGRRPAGPGAGGRRPAPFGRERARPRKSPLSQRTTQPSPAWSGVIPSPSSWPCSGSPASSRSVSRAPSPAGVDAGRDDRPPEARRVRRGHVDLDAILAGVPGAGDDARNAVPTHRRDREPLDRRQRRVDGREQRAAAVGPCTASTARVAVMSSIVDRPARRRPRPRPRAPVIAIGVRRVRHHEELVGRDPPHDDVVDDVRVVRIEQVRVLRPPGRDAVEVVRERALQQRVRVGAGDPQRAEVRDVEDDRARSGRPGAPRARRRTGSASPSRRTRRAWRRGRGARRRAGCGGGTGPGRSCPDARAPGRVEASAGLALAVVGACVGRGPSSWMLAWSDSTSPASGTMFSTPWPLRTRSTMSSPVRASTDDEPSITRLDDARSSPRWSRR